jgi:hypothetical protein
VTVKQQQHVAFLRPKIFYSLRLRLAVAVLVSLGTMATMGLVKQQL